MSEGIELPESHHLREDHPLILPVSLTISIMAVFVAGVSLLGHRAHTEGLIFPTRLSSRNGAPRDRSGQPLGPVSGKERPPARSSRIFRRGQACCSVEQGVGRRAERKVRQGSRAL